MKRYKWDRTGKEKERHPYLEKERHTYLEKERHTRTWKRKDTRTWKRKDTCTWKRKDTHLYLERKKGNDNMLSQCPWVEDLLYLVIPSCAVNSSYDIEDQIHYKSITCGLS